MACNTYQTKENSSDRLLRQPLGLARNMGMFRVAPKGFTNNLPISKTTSQTLSQRPSYEHKKQRPQSIDTLDPLYCKSGRRTRIRTLDPLLPKQVRYQAALHADS